MSIKYVAGREHGRSDLHAQRVRARVYQQIQHAVTHYLSPHGPRCSSRTCIIVWGFHNHAIVCLAVVLLSEQISESCVQLRHGRIYHSFLSCIHRPYRNLGSLQCSFPDSCCLVLHARSSLLMTRPVLPCLEFMKCLIQSEFKSVHPVLSIVIPSSDE